MCEHWALCPYSWEKCGECNPRECMTRALDEESQEAPVPLDLDDFEDCHGDL